MPWVKLDDGYWSNPKVVAVGNEAAGAYARMLSYCGQQLTDGRVEDHVAKFICKPAMVKRLEAHGFIEPTEDGYRIPDYLDFNPTRAKAEKERAKARERMRKLRENGA